jgi:Leucine-rich repeat (LRR) protein
MPSKGLTGNIPSSLGELPDLVYLNLDRNTLNGSIPSSFSQLSKLATFIVGENELQGKVPEFSNTLISCDISLGHYTCNHKNNTACATTGVQGKLIPR